MTSASLLLDARSMLARLADELENREGEAWVIRELDEVREVLAKAQAQAQL